MYLIIQFVIGFVLLNVIIVSLNVTLTLLSGLLERPKRISK